MSYVAEWARFFGLTLGVELAVAVPLLAGHGSVIRRTGAVLFGQLASHPLVWFVIPALGLGGARFLVAAETWAVLCELLLYRLVFPRLTWAGALAVSALANGASVIAGIIARSLST